MGLRDKKNTAAVCNDKEILMPDFYYEEKAKWDAPEERPPCPKCGSRPWRNGMYWYCRKCGKSWADSPLIKTGFPERPDCPECGGKPYSRGAGWICKDCGRNWMKNPRRK